MSWITTKTGTRDYTNELLAMAEDGLVSWESVARSCLGYMSEDDVKDMSTSEGFIDEDEDEDEDDNSEDCDEFEPAVDFEEQYELGEEPKSCRICEWWNDTMGRCMLAGEPR